jgi:hypothetical protein
MTGKKIIHNIIPATHSLRPCPRDDFLTEFAGIYFTALTITSLVLHNVKWYVTSESYCCSSSWRPIGLRDVRAPAFSRQSAHRLRLGCQPYASAALYLPRKISVTHFCSNLSRSQDIARLERLSQLKNPVPLFGIEPMAFPLVA